MPRLNPLVTSLPTYPIVELDRRKAALVAAGRPVYDFGTGDPVEPAPSFVRTALIEAVTPSCPYPSVAGKLPVRAAIARYLKRRFGVTVDPETQILPTSGSKEAVFHTPQLVIDPFAEDKLVVFPDPGYPAYERGALFAYGTPHPVVLDGDHVFRPWLLDPAVLRQTRMMWINSPHNPSGAITSLRDLERTVEVCQQYDILLLSDETYADIYQDVVPHSVLEVSTQGVVALHSLSKRSGMTGYRAGFLAGDADIMGRLKSLRANPGLVPQDFVNAASIVAWDDDAHVAERRSIFAAKKAVMMAFFREVGIEVVGSEATIYLWIRTPAGFTDEAYALRLLDAGIVATPGPMFAVGGGGKGFLRLALVPSVSQCEAAVAAWRAIL
jgi:succinyldiaminopimelate transaminase